MAVFISQPACAGRNIALSSPTHALLPNGLALEVVGGALIVDRAGIRAPVPLPADWPGYRARVAAITEVVASDDKSSVKIKFQDACGHEDEFNVKLNSLWARTEGALAMAALAGKDFSRAALGFSRALEFDPDYDEAAFRLTASNTLLGKTTQAIDTLAPLILKNPEGVYLRCLSDPDLSTLLESPQILRLVHPSPGLARLDKDKVIVASPEFLPGRLVAYEPVRGLAAAVERTVETKVQETCPWRSSLDIVDVKTGRTLAKLPLVSAKDTAKNKSCRTPEPAPKSAAKEISKRVALANRALANLGFNLPDQQEAATAPIILSGYAQRLEWSVYLPAFKLTVFQWGQEPQASCPKNFWGGIGVLAP